MDAQAQLGATRQAGIPGSQYLAIPPQKLSEYQQLLVSKRLVPGGVVARRFMSPLDCSRAPTRSSTRRGYCNCAHQSSGS